MHTNILQNSFITSGTWHCSDRQYSDRHCSDRHCSDRHCSDKRYPWALYTVSQKTRHQSLANNFTKYLLIFTILSLLDSVVICNKVIYKYPTTP